MFPPFCFLYLKVSVFITVGCKRSKNVEKRVAEGSWDCVGASAGHVHCGEGRAARPQGHRQEGHCPRSVQARTSRWGSWPSWLGHIADLPQPSEWAPGVEESCDPLAKHPKVKYQREALLQRQAIKTEKGPPFLVL